MKNLILALALALVATPAAAQTKSLGDIVNDVNETCPTGLRSELREALGPNHPLQGEWFIMLADNYRYAECYDQAESIYASVASNRYASSSSRADARVGLDRVLARR